MGPDEKNTGPLAVYMDGQPVGIAYGEIQEISLVAEEPAEAMPPAVISGGSMTITLEQASEAAGKILKEDPELERPEYEKLKERLKGYMSRSAESLSL